MVGISVPTLRKRLGLFFKRARKQLGADGVPVLTGALLILPPGLLVLFIAGSGP